MELSPGEPSSSINPATIPSCSVYRPKGAFFEGVPNFVGAPTSSLVSLAANYSPVLNAARRSSYGSNPSTATTSQDAIPVVSIGRESDAGRQSASFGTEVVITNSTMNNYYVHLL